MEKTKQQTCLIVGASHAGVNAAFALRREGWLGRIVLFDRDPNLPYHRPPLSKGFLSGEAKVEDNPLKAQLAYDKNEIELQLGHEVREIDRQAKTLTLSDGSVRVYDQLLLATGARPLLPPIPGLRDNKRVFPLRTAADALGIQAAFAAGSGKRVVVIGGGYIGLEAAASLRKLGGEVSVLEREDRVLARVTSPEMSAFFTDLHREKGVVIATGRNVQSIVRGEDALMVSCADGSNYPADLVIVGAGVQVNNELARQAGLEITNGIQVNDRAQTSDPNVYAIGDCTCFYHPRYGRELRLESVQHAVDQAKIAAANICGKDLTYTALPWFWSDQYETKLQMAGLATGYDRLVLRQENGDDPHQRSCWYFKGEKLLAVDAVNHARAYMLGMKLLKTNMHPDPDKLKDLSVNLHPKTII